MGGLGTRNNLEHFGDVTFKPLNTGFIFLYFWESPCLWATLWKNGWMDFMKFSIYLRYLARNNLEHFDAAAFNPLGPGLIFLFYGSVFASNIMEKQVNGFSWNFQDMSEVTQQNIWLDCFMHLTRLFHAWLYCSTVPILGLASYVC